MQAARILVVDDSAVDREIISIVCEALGCEVDVAEDGDSAMKMYDADRHTVLLTDYWMSPINGVNLVKRVKEIHPEFPCVMMTVNPNADVLRFTQNDEFCELILKPIQVKDLAEKLSLVLGRKRGVSSDVDQVVLSNRMDQCFPLVGQSKKIREVRQHLMRAIGNRGHVLLEGPIGVGKAEVAHLIHKHGPYAKSHFVECFCADLDASAIEQELIHPDGVWGTTLERARNGTLAMYDIETLPMKTQEVLGAYFSGISSEIYVIAQAHTCLEEQMNEGRFDPRLYFEVAMDAVRMPTLVERREDLPDLIAFISSAYRRFEMTRALTEAEQHAIWQELSHADLGGNLDVVVEHVRRYLAEFSDESV